MPAIIGLVEAQSVIEPNAINFEFLHPIDASIPDVLQRASIRIIKVLKKRMLRKVAYVGRVRWLLVCPVVRKSKVWRLRICMVEHAIHQHLDTPVMTLADQVT